MPEPTHSTRPANVLMRDKGWLLDGIHVVETSIAGDGNMNLVERLRLSDGRSLILKRSRAWVEKYPDIPAPVSRATVEADFYRAVAGTPAGDAMPAHLQYDPTDATNLFSDLGQGMDGSFVYSGKTLPLTDLDAVADWAAQLHALPLKTEWRDRLDNAPMRALNATHIFDFPLDPDNGFDLDAITPGLQTLGDRLKTDTAFRDAVQSVRALYLKTSPAETDVLLHGDLYPGSWLRTRKGLFVIDPEFCWLGPAEWDMGVLIAHLRLSGQAVDHETHLLHSYGRPLETDLLQKVTGIEMMRRLIGVAQLPINLDLDAKQTLLTEARARATGDWT